MRVYIAGPLFNEMERSRNEEIATLLESAGIQTYLPQRDGGVFSELRFTHEVKELRKRIFDADLKALSSCNAIVCLLDGRVPDEGMCVELGMAYALKKRCIGYKTDSRTVEGENMNIILEGTLDNIFTDKDTFLEYVKSLIIQ